LKDFARIILESGETKTVEFKLGKEKFELYNDEGEKFLPKGDFKIYAGGSVPSERSMEMGSSQPAVYNVYYKLLK
jgi:beta-glucosidase